MDVSNITNISSLQGVAYYANSMTDGIIVSGGLIVLFFVMVLVLLKNDSIPLSNVLAVSGWSFFIISAIFWLAGLVEVMFPLGFLFVGGVATFMLYAGTRY